MDISKILQEIRPNCFYSINGDSYDGLVWEDCNTQSKPSLEEITEAHEAFKNKWLWEFTRTERNRRLQECDYTQLPDFTGNKEAWVSYRNALRNIPQTFGNPESVVWPSKPN
jgi:hypothetical protein